MIQQLENLQTLLNIGQPVDWDAIYASELPRVYNYFLYKICNRELAQDLTAVTFERAWKIRSKYNAIIASPSTWLLGIARNVCREHFRENKENETEPLIQVEQLPSDADIEKVFQEQREKELLRSLLLELPEREQDLIALKYGAGLTNRAIANITRLSESNVGSILHRTIAELRRKME
ncbi:MAG: RNA polymerase sigma factor [Chloroflexota bacterium]